MSLVECDEWRACEGCGMEFRPAVPTSGPMARYHSPNCRKRAYLRRRRLTLAVRVADEGLTAGHGPLAEALAVLSPTSLNKVRRVLLSPSERNLSHSGGDGLCSADTTGADRVVSRLHNEEG
jgi:hypothetical protein